METIDNEIEFYKSALYRRNSSGEPYVWHCDKADDCTIRVRHGIVGGKIHEDFYKTARNVIDEINSRFNAKIKSGYSSIDGIRDSCTHPVEEDVMSLRSWLNAYLPVNRSTGDDVLLPMLAKTFDDKVFKRCSSYQGQWKINGLRCFAKPYIKKADMFSYYGFIFQSREGIVWNSLPVLEEYLLYKIPHDVIKDMIDNNMIFDGELYIPHRAINELNHIVKDSLCNENKLIQYWIYDIAIEDIPQWKRTDYLQKVLGKDVHRFTSKDEHYSNKDRLVVLPYEDIVDSDKARKTRDYFIDLGFEGLILRNPDAEYQYGKRKAGVMVKYKKSTDGIFTVIDIYPEGVKRADIPLLLCKNDINDELFEVHLSESLDVQRKVLRKRSTYIGKQVNIEYGERSGIAQLPFHCKSVHFVK